MSRRALLLLAAVLASLALLASPAGRADDEAPEPYRRLFVEPPRFRGPGAETPEPEGLEVVKLGVIAPLRGRDEAVGTRMVRGVTLAVEEANAKGGLRPGLPFAILVREEDPPWGSAANAVVELASNHGVWAVLGGVDDRASHAMARVLARLDVPMVNAAGGDPALTKQGIAWLVRMRPGARQSADHLVDRIFRKDAHKRVAVLRSADRFGRTGAEAFAAAVRHSRESILSEVAFLPHEREFAAHVERLREMKPDAVVLWGRPLPCGRALRALRAAGLRAPAYVGGRCVDPAFLAAAGDAAEGTVFTHPFDLGKEDATWTAFQTRFRDRFHVEAEATAAYAYDAARYLIEAIRAAGLNRVRIRKRLFARRTFEGVMGTIPFDMTQDNAATVVLGRVEGGRFRFE